MKPRTRTTITRLASVTAPLALLALAPSQVSAGTFCDELVDALKEGKNEFVDIKGRFDRELGNYDTDFMFSELTGPDPYCVLRADEERETQLELDCVTTTGKSEAKSLYSRLASEATSCIRQHFPRASAPSPRAGTTKHGLVYDKLEFENIDTTVNGWRLALTVRYTESFSQRRQQDVYRASVTINFK